MSTQLINPLNRWIDIYCQMHKVCREEKIASYFDLCSALQQMTRQFKV